MVWRLATRNLRASPLRLVLISLAIILGVGFVGGAFVLADTINKPSIDLFAKVDAGVAVQVQGVASVSSADRQPVPASLLARDPSRRRGRQRGGRGRRERDGHRQQRQGGRPGRAAQTLGFGWSQRSAL